MKIHILLLLFMPSLASSQSSITKSEMFKVWKLIEGKNHFSETETYFHFGANDTFVVINYELYTSTWYLNGDTIQFGESAYRSFIVKKMGKNKLLLTDTYDKSTIVLEQTNWTWQDLQSEWATIQKENGKLEDIEFISIPPLDEEDLVEPLPRFYIPPDFRQYLEVDELPEFSLSNEDSLRNYLRRKTGFNMHDEDNRQYELVAVGFFVLPDGDVTNPIVLESLMPEFDSLALQAISSLPNFEKPGMINGKAVKCFHYHPVEFLMPDDYYDPYQFMYMEAYELYKELRSETDVHEYVEQMPEFSEGTDSLMRYMSTIDYPPLAKEHDIEGTVHIRFVIDEVGKVCRVAVIGDIDMTLAKAAVAHVQNMPLWKPGYDEGKPVKVQKIIPITFRLE